MLHSDIANACRYAHTNTFKSHEQWLDTRLLVTTFQLLTELEAAVSPTREVPALLSVDFRTFLLVSQDTKGSAI